MPPPGPERIATEFGDDDVVSSCAIEAVRIGADGSVDQIATVSWIVTVEGAYLIGAEETLRAVPAGLHEVLSALHAVLGVVAERS
jgi:hypothetical protein